MEQKKRKANPVFGERKKRQKERAFTGIKTGVIKLCRDDTMYALLRDCVSRSSVIAAEASLLTSLHVTRLLERGSAATGHGLHVLQPVCLHHRQHEHGEVV